MLVLSKGEDPRYLWIPAAPNWEEYPRIRQHLRDGDWILHDISGDNLIEQVLIGGRCRAFGKNDIRVLPEDQWLENRGVE